MLRSLVGEHVRTHTACQDEAVDRGRIPSFAQQRGGSNQHSDFAFDEKPCYEANQILIGCPLKADVQKLLPVAQLLHDQEFLIQFSGTRCDFHCVGRRLGYDHETAAENTEADAMDLSPPKGFEDRHHTKLLKVVPIILGLRQFTLAYEICKNY